MIYRAICHSTHEHAPSMEEIVYINGGARGEIRQKLATTLAVIWNVPAESIDYYNLKSEQELIEESIGGEATGDARLFEIGSHQGPIYASVPPLFLLRPKDTARMLKAWAALSQQNDLPWTAVSEGLPPLDTGERVLIYTEGSDFQGEQFFDIKADDLYPCPTENDPEGEEPRTEVAAAATHWTRLPFPRKAGVPKK